MLPRVEQRPLECRSVYYYITRLGGNFKVRSSFHACNVIQGGAEPTDTFRIGILRRRDSLSWLAAREQWRRGRHFIWYETVWLLFVKCSELLSLVSATSLGLHGRPTLLYQTFSWGVPEIPCVPVAYHDYSRTETSHCWRSCGYWWPTEARLRQLPDTLATMHWCKRRPSAWCNFQKISL